MLLANYMSPMGLPRRVTGEGGDLNEYAIFMGIQMFIIGQFLNWAVYATIGKKGVYYGCRLGEKVSCHAVPCHSAGIASVTAFWFSHFA